MVVVIVVCCSVLVLDRLAAADDGSCVDVLEGLPHPAAIANRASNETAATI